MALNKFMHPKNRYKENPPDFDGLAEEFPNFKKHVQHSRNGKAFVNFRNANVVRELAICLLKRDFQLDVLLPNDRLAPTIPSRLNYILWAQDLVCCLPSQDSYSILDIGCGSSCVYPLLGVRLNKSWNFLASEIDEKNFLCAQDNVRRNNLSEKILLHQVAENDKIFSPLGDAVDIDACMCNPPFFTSKQDVVTGLQRPSANSSCSGHEKEMIRDEGGDLGFAEKLFTESLEVRKRVKWFTTMFGKKSSFVCFRKKLESCEVPVKTYTEFCQGKTMRWAVAWSYISNIDVQTLPLSQFQQEKLHKSSKKIHFKSKFVEVTEVKNALSLVLNKLSLSFTLEGDEDLQFEFLTRKSDWTNSRRKRRMKMFGDKNEKTLCNAERKLISKSVHDSFDNDGQIGSDLQFQCRVTISSTTSGIEVTVSSCPFLKDEINTIAVYLKGKI